MLGRFFFSETVTVLVGAGGSKSSFSVHTSILKQRSSFFEAALSGRWESTSRGIELPDDDPAVFDRYLRCLYRNEHHIRLDGKPSSTPLQNCEPLEHTPEQNQDMMMLYAKIYILADKLGDCVSTNMLIEALIYDTLLSPSVFGRRLSTLSGAVQPPHPLCVKPAWTPGRAWYHMEGGT